MKILFRLLLITGLLIVNGVRAGIDVTLNKYNPVLLDSTEFPINFLYERAKANLMQGNPDTGSGLKLSITPYYTQANKGTNLLNVKNSQLGDLSGRWNLLTILNTNVPAGYVPSDLLGGTYYNGTEYVTVNSTLLGVSASYATGGYGLLGDLDNLEYGIQGQSGSYPIGVTPQAFTTLPGLISLQDNTETFGYMTVPAKYRSYGARLEIGASLDCGLGALVKMGFGSAAQTGAFNNAIYFGGFDLTYYPSSTSSTTTPTTTTVTIPDAAYYFWGDVQRLVNNPFNNLISSYYGGSSSTTPTYSQVDAPTNPQWYTALKTVAVDTSNQINLIAQAIGLNLNDFQKTGFEDLRIEVFWRKAVTLEHQEARLFIPYLSMVATLDLAEAADPMQPLAVSLGNNGHRSLGGTSGFTIVLNEGLEFGAAVGAFAYSCRTEQRQPMPNNVGQSGIYPFSTQTKIKPGHTWYVSLLGNSYHFEENASFFMQYLYVNHSRDKYTPVNPDPVYMPGILEGKSIWSNHTLNCGLNVDLSDSITIGAAVEIPLKQKASARTSSLVASLILTN